VHFWLAVLGEDAEQPFLHEVGMSKCDHEAYVETVRHYRDKFVAHLDSDRTMNVAELGHVLKTVSLLYEKVRPTIDPSAIPEFPLDFMAAYDQSLSEALAEYRMRLEHGLS
jgi:hypothetical protein